MRNILGVAAASAACAALGVSAASGGTAPATSHLQKAAERGVPASVSEPVALATAAAPASQQMPAIVPKPVTMTTGAGQFTLTPHTQIAAGSPQALAVANDLAGDLRPATGYRLPVRISRLAGDSSTIKLSIGNPPALAGHPEGYQLAVTQSGVDLVGTNAEALFDGVQTIRQLLPGWIDSPKQMAGPWTMPDVSITDYPRFSYRGFMIDIARHFEPPSAVEQLINIASQYKMNVLHLHLSDGQAFRVAIKGFPNLTNIGGMGSVGTDGRTMDPGGFWTQAQYKSVVAYANAHFMTVIPEIDTPSHDNAIVMSEYNDVSNPLLDASTLHGINCGLKNPPQWNFTTDVGYSGLCADNSNTWVILTHIIDQISRMSNSPYYDIGGDEASRVFTDAQYAAFVNEEMPIVEKAGETPMGWSAGLATTAGTNPPKGSIAESWEPGATDAPAAVAKGMKVVMAPADHAYLDQSYPDHAGGLGLDWACEGCDLDQNYNWDPTGTPGVPASSVIGVEGALFGETIPTLSDAEFLMLPRVMAIAEIGWSPDTDRTTGGTANAAFQDFVKRVAAQGTRLQAAGYNFYTTAQVPWQLNGAGVVGADISRRHHSVSGEIGVLSAPGFATQDLSATVNWGDGTSSPAVLSGTPPTPLTTPTPVSPPEVNSLYTVSAVHTFTGAVRGPVTVTVTSTSGQRTTFAVQLAPGGRWMGSGAH